MGLSNNLGKLSNMITSTGSAVGIAQTSPSYTLDVTGTGRYTSTLLVGGTATFSGDAILSYNKSLAFNSTSNQYISADTSNLYLGTANSARLTINTSGFVGIGTTGPSDILDVQRNQNATTNFYLRNTNTTDTNSRAYLNVISGNVTLQLKAINSDNVYIAPTSAVTTYLGYNNLFSIDSSGNTNIQPGTYNRVRTYFTGAYTSGWQFSDLLGGIWHNAAIDQLNIHSNAAGGYITMTTNGSERLRVTNNGSIILNGNNFGSVYNFSFKGVTGLDCFAALSVRSNGDNIINFFNGSSGYVASISVAASSVTYGTGSDYRLKEDLRDFDGLEKVSAIKVYDFKFKAEGDRMEGVLAHELQEVIPYAVTGYKDEVDADGNAKIQNVDYSKLVPVLVKAIQELNAKVTALENR